MDELRTVLSRPKFHEALMRRDVAANVLFDGYLSLIELVEPPHVPVVVPDDPDDDHVIAAAVTAHADLIVSGDSHLAKLETHRGIRIVPARVAADSIIAAGYHT